MVKELWAFIRVIMAILGLSLCTSWLILLVMAIIAPGILGAPEHGAWGYIMGIGSCIIMDSLMLWLLVSSYKSWKRYLSKGG